MFGVRQLNLGWFRDYKALSLYRSISIEFSENYQLVTHFKDGFREHMFYLLVLLFVFQKVLEYELH